MRVLLFRISDFPICPSDIAHVVSRGEETQDPYSNQLGRLRHQSVLAFVADPKSILL